MSSLTLSQHVPNRDAVDDRLAGARFQIETLKGLLGSSSLSVPHAESCVNAAIDQLLLAITATLDGFNSMLPDPLPSQHVNRKNIRERFYAVGAESIALQSLDGAAHTGDGWLWNLEQKHDGAAFGHLLVKTKSSESTSFALAKDPLNPESGNEDGSPVDYLNYALDQVVQIIGEVADKASDDAMNYREAERRQARRLI